MDNPFFRFMAGWGFPAFLSFVLLFATLLLGLVLVIPTEATALDAFAEDFKIWCFGYDPETGSLQWAYVISMLTSPLLMVAFTLSIWWGQIRGVWRSAPTRLLWAAGPAGVLVLSLAVGMGMVGSSADAQDRFAFPAERLRTSQEPPELLLTDHEGNEVSLEGLRGRVVVVTGVYATCGFTCPMIMAQAKRVVSGLTEEEMGGVSVVAITLDPEHDDQEKLAEMAQAQGVSSPLFHLTTGDPERVNSILDRFGITRSRDPETGVIDHANLFILIDREGRIAYRFSLGEQQEEWFGEALRLLVAEEPG